MNGLGSTLYGWYLQIWPNLAASVIWAIPAFTWHHRRIKRHITAQHEQTVSALAEKVSGNG